ncbi:MAG: glycosyltransferase family 39 protein, partial [Clostridia bacterium]|nr:glycosyltransferase family 39 protein [Clostridia bacterium]
MKGKKVYNSKALVWWGLAGVVLLAFILRLAWVLNVHTYPISDFGWYHERALGLIHGQGYSVNGKPTAYWPIGYPLFLAGLYKLFGPHYYVAKAANVIMGSLTAGLTYLIGNRLAGFWTGLFAGLALALMPSQIEWTSVLCSEILFTFLLLASTYLLVVKRPERQGWLYPAVSGLLLGAASLVRATSLALPLGAFVFYWIFRRSFRQAKFIQLLGVKFRKFYQSDTNAYLFSLTPTHPPL